MASAEVPPTPNQSSAVGADLDYHRIKTPKLTGRLHNTSWSHSQSYGENEINLPDWLSDRERTTVVRSVPKLKLHEEEFAQSPRTVAYTHQQNLTQYEQHQQQQLQPQFRLVYPRHMLSSLRKVTGLNNFIVQPNAVAPTPEERFNITRELIVKSSAPKIDSGYAAHVSHRPEFAEKQFHQTINGAYVPTGDPVRDRERQRPPKTEESGYNLQRSQTVPDDLLLSDFEDLDLEELQNDIIFTKDYFEALDSPMRQSLLRLKERKTKERYAFKEKNVQRVKTREYLQKQLTRTNYISSSLGVLMASGDQSVFERDLTWKTARKIEILRNKSRSTPLVPYGILYPRIGGITRFQGRPTKGEISLIEKRVGNMSKTFLDNKENIKAWKASDEPISTAIPNEDDESRNLSSLDVLSPEERRQYAEDEAKVSRIRHSFEKLPNIDKKTAEIMARQITEDERREFGYNPNQFDNISLNGENRIEPRRGKAPTGTLFKSNLVQRNKPKEPTSSSDQFGLGKTAAPPKDPNARKLARKPPKTRPAFPAKQKLAKFNMDAPPATPSESKREPKDDSADSNKVFITQPREISNVEGTEPGPDDKARAISSSGRKSVSFDDEVETKSIDENEGVSADEPKASLAENQNISDELGSTSTETKDTNENEKVSPSSEKEASLAETDTSTTAAESAQSESNFPNKDINDTSEPTLNESDVQKDDGKIIEADKEVQAEKVQAEETDDENYLKTITESNHE